MIGARRRRSTRRGSLRVCRQAESCWRKERRACGSTSTFRAFALQTDGAGAESLSVWDSRGGGQCVESSSDAIDHGWLMRFVEHRVSDKRVGRHIKKWRNAGVLEEGNWRQVEMGVSQGSSIGPLLANIYLHYAFDLWAQQWRERYAHGDVVLVRYADDIAAGFEHRSDAERFLAELRERFARFALELHPDKTRIIEFGRFAALNARRRGEGKPETFDFIGFTHSCDKTRKGKFIVLRQSMKKRTRRKLREVKTKLRARLHAPASVRGSVETRATVWC
ncbi:MAG: hypothetical protein HY899_09705 [Deltaproteobacteria bacterium]|nr:hypothetical protein [Deltaproteobacteria bacterium]